ncbi:MAG: DEAD/DEAH box helicase, partial [Verrucomicrobiaceae bacterium]
AYYRGHILGDETLQASALRWLRAEYDSKMEARQDLGVRRIILDENFLESLKLMAAFLRRAGYAGLLVNLDEMVVLSHRLPNSRARQSNYEALLSLLNDSFQGSAKGLGFIFAGTDDCLEDKRRGLFSYEALRSRLAENTFARGEGLTDLSGPVIRLQPLTPEDLFVLLRNIALVHAGGNPAKVITPDDAIAAVLQKANETLGAGFFRTPRDIVRGFIGLLNILDQNPDRTWQSVLSATTFKTPATASGKTEAAFLPVLSRIASDPADSVQAIYISPLRALINDQFRRLEELCKTADIPVHRWHGDVGATERKRLRENPGGVLLITPESLEAHFCHQDSHLARIYA